MCKNPFRRGVEEFGCGQCLPCRMNRRRLWTSRIMLESAQHAESCFVTLTYREECYPNDGKVSKQELQRFLKRLRFAVYPRRVRYYGVGEYGGQTGRAHYHVLLFGLGRENHENPRKNFACSCSICVAWPFGGVYVGDVEPESASYVLGYLTKESKADFALMSRKPGIGGYSAKVIGDALCTKEGSTVVAAVGDVPGVVRRARKLWPLGRYLRGRLRQEVGMEVGEPEEQRNARLEVLQVDLCTVAGRERHEGKRSSDVARAEARAQISRSKKGIGL